MVAPLAPHRLHTSPSKCNKPGPDTNKERLHLVTSNVMHFTFAYDRSVALIRHCCVNYGVSVSMVRIVNDISLRASMYDISMHYLIILRERSIVWNFREMEEH